MDRAQQIETSVDIFLHDLWKDQRKLVVNPDGFPNCLEKISSNPEENKTEYSVINYLYSHGLSSVPIIIHSTSNSIVMKYYQGIRLFNLLVILDEISESPFDFARTVKDKLIERTLQQELLIQSKLKEWGDTQNRKIVYPYDKMSSLFILLSNMLNIDVDYSRLDTEMHELYEYWAHFATVPFRDATTKNIMICDPELMTNKFESENQRTEYIKKCLNDGSFEKWFEVPTIDFDFSSCVHYTTLEDDIVSILFHERTWNGVLPCISDFSCYNEKVDIKSLIITFIIRYYRFGARKAAYRFLHPVGHRKRFMYDSDTFYFHRLIQIIDYLWDDFKFVYPCIYQFTKQVSKYLEITKPDIDYFLALDNTPAKYYFDVFPY